MKAIALVVLAAVSAVLAAPSANPEPQPGDLCGMCKTVVSQLKEGEAVTQVEEAMDKVCDIMPHFLHDACMDFIGGLKQQLEEMKEADPEETCEELGFCPKEPEPPVPKTPVPAHPNGIACDMCKWGWEAIEKSSPTPEQVQEQLETTCNMLPDELKEACNDAIKQIVDQYREGRKLTAQEACERLQVCDAQPTTTAATTTATTTTTTGPVPTAHNAYQAMIEYLKRVNSNSRQQLKSADVQ